MVIKILNNNLFIYYLMHTWESVVSVEVACWYNVSLLTGAVTTEDSLFSLKSFALTSVVDWTA